MAIYSQTNINIMKNEPGKFNLTYRFFILLNLMGVEPKSIN